MKSGVSFWLPGLYGSLAAVPQAAPGWSFYTFNYYDRVSAGGNVAARARVPDRPFHADGNCQPVCEPQRQGGPPMDPTELRLRDPGSRRAV